MAPEQTRLVSLLGERYTLLRKESQRLLNGGEGISLTASEWYVLGKIADSRVTVTQLARTADMTRQAAHKYARALADKGLLLLEAGEGHRRYMAITGLGKRCAARYQDLQLRLEAQLVQALGEEEIKRLVRVLDQDWEGCLKQLEPVDDQPEF